VGVSSLYDLTVTLNANVVGLTSGIALAIRAFQNVQQEAGRTQTAVQNALTQRSSTYAAVARSTNSLQASQLRYNTALQDHLRISSQYGATSDAAGRSLNRLQQAHLSLANAQLTQASAANRAANAHAQYTAASAAAVAAASREDRMNRGMNQLAVGGIETGLGLGIWGYLGGAIRNAMGYQTVQRGIGQALTDASGRRLSPTQNAGALAALQNQEVTIGLRNQMSVTDVANIVSAATHAGMTRADVLMGARGQQGILPGLANFAEVLKMTRGYSPEQSATTATQFAHLFGAWTPATFNRMTDLLGRALFVSPAGPQQFLTLISQFAGSTRALYGRGAANQQRFITDTIRSGLLLTELGQETRGGTQLAQLIAGAALPINCSMNTTNGLPFGHVGLTSNDALRRAAIPHIVWYASNL
jgi:hypothetical protein